MRQRLMASLARPRFNASVLAAVSIVALMLAAVGVYGVIAAIVRQRTHEIGVRLALGAQAHDVRWMVLKHGLVLGGVGVAVGITIAAIATRSLGAVLYGVSPTDPLTIAVASGTLLAVAALGCWIPARAATRVDPLIAMKTE
jgi:ABC-type antimicrobial peptide transport system permease subunit